MAPKRRPSRRTAARPSRTVDKKAAPNDGMAASRGIREVPPRAAALTVSKAGAKPVESRGKYVYCVIRSEDALRFGALFFGTVHAEVSTVHYQYIVSLVTDTPIEFLHI